MKLTIDTIRKIMEEESSYRRILKTDINNISYDLIEYVQDRLGHDARYAIDPSKIAVELGWYPETTFTKGIEKTIRWYLDNQEWVNSLNYDARYAIDPSKIAVELGWYPETTFTKGIEKTIRWYLDNQEWVNSLN